MKKITYSELVSNFIKFNKDNNITSKGNEKKIKGVIVFTEDSWDKLYTLEERSYEVTSDNKAFILGMLGYSIYGNSLDGGDLGVRLEQYMAAEKGGPDGWKVDYCYMLDNNE